LVANLLVNAIKHNRDGGWITARTATDADDALLLVANSGAIIRPESLGELTRPFRRGGTARTGDGHGLGLTIARAVAEAHDGRLEIEALNEGGLCITTRIAAQAARPLPALAQSAKGSRELNP
jgi:signal transduction histidine kinase